MMSQAVIGRTACYQQGMPRQEMAQLLYNLCDNGEIVVGDLLKTQS
ncbi:MAG: hypothetical protein LIO60_05160 [Oscillospiraceae bacterium]|nr:hypothetical protein [Oscillospiraceae bacterium]